MEAAGRPVAAASAARRLRELGVRRTRRATGASAYVYREARAGAERLAGPVLWTASLGVGSSAGVLTLFHAAVACSLKQYAERLASRIGGEAVPLAVVAPYDASDPLPALLLSTSLAGFLRTVAEDPGSELCRGFELYVEHRMGG